MNKTEKENKPFFYHPFIDYSKPLLKSYVVGKNIMTGHQIVYSGKNIPKNIEDFYDKKLKKANWERSFDLNADGPFGNAWGYKKGNKKIIFTLKIILRENKKNIYMSKIRGYRLTILSNDKSLF
jgi:hypothetical protein